MQLPTIRAAGINDIAAIAAIYGQHVQHGFGTFETEPPSISEMQNRYAAITGHNFPFLVAEENNREHGRVLGYAYANHFRTRAAYRYTVEDSIYIAPDAAGRGVGKLLLNALIERCAAQGLRQMLAVIGDSNNAASIGLHRACGFVHKGTLPSVGMKHDRWVDIVIMQRSLGDGDHTPPL